MTRSGIGYWLRPYDMLADRRRWRWQKPAPCGRQVFAALPPTIAEDIERIVAAQEAARCPLPPVGWWCSLEPGHEGPCPARRRIRLSMRPLAADPTNDGTTE